MNLLLLSLRSSASRIGVGIIFAIMALCLTLPCTAATGNIDRICHGNTPILAPTNSFSSKAKGNGNRRRRLYLICAFRDKDTTKESNNSVEQVTRKYGLEAGLWKIFTSKDDAIANGEHGKEKKKNEAKDLLARYGGAYLATSITLSVVSFSACYLLINAGVDVQALLDKVGIHTNETGEKVGTFALAYAAHKAASPIRFPPTVALTPIVAGWFGKNSKDKEENQTT